MSLRCVSWWLVFLGGCFSASGPSAVPDGGAAAAAVAEEEDGWVEAAVAEALAWEIMPGTSGEAEPGREAALRAFFRAHPEYADAERRASLADMACAMGTEAAHERLRSPVPPTPLVVSVSAPSWRLVIVHASGWCTSDDWSGFTQEVQESLQARGVQVDYAGPEHSEVVVMWEGQEAARHPLREQGYLVLAADREALEVAHQEPVAVMSAVDGYLGL